VLDREGYRLADASEMLPGGLGNARFSEAGLRIMQAMYRQLALYHIDYSDVYVALEDYLGRLEEHRMGRRSSSQIDAPNVFAHSVRGQVQASDRSIKVRRESEEPLSYSHLPDAIDQIDMHVRTARFLNPDGATRAEIYWGAIEDAFYPSPDGRRLLREEGFDPIPETYLIMGTVVPMDANYVPMGRDQHRNMVTVERGGTGLTMPPQYRIASDQEIFHVAVQWDLYAMFPEEDRRSIPLGPLVKRHVFKADTIEALRTDELEMSDLKPVHYPAGAMMDLDEEIARTAAGYPYDRVSADMPIALYFEIYNLRYGANDQARYSVEYEVARPAGFDVLGRARSGERTTARTTYTADESRTSQLIIPDTEAWRAGGLLEIVVRVRDEVAGTVRERSIAFTIPDRSPAPRQLTP
jgi:hypothetical protein